MGRRKRFVLIVLLVLLLILTSTLERASWEVTQFVSRMADQGLKRTRLLEPAAAPADPGVGEGRPDGGG